MANTRSKAQSRRSRSEPRDRQTRTQHHVESNSHAEASSATSHFESKVSTANRNRKRKSPPASHANQSRKRRLSTLTNVPSPTDPSSESSSDEDRETKGEYRYKTLKPGHIRILTIFPRLHDSVDSTLDCSLTERKLQDSDRVHRRESKDGYEALSYVWGKDIPEEHIHIRRSNNRGSWTFKVTKNLMTALKHLRFEDKPRHFWVDAICMDQTSGVEKNQQVPMMSKIYSEAKNVCIWLGDRDETSPLAMQLLPKIRNIHKFEQNVKNYTNCEEWDALLQLMGRPWFTRRWVVQEIALARRASIHCGSEEVPWSHFSEAIALFQAAADEVNQKFRENKAYDYNPAYVGSVEAYAASRLVAATSQVVRKSKDNRLLQKISSLEYLVSTLTPFRATDAADTIYAVLSLAKDVPGFPTIIAPTATIEAASQRNDDVFEEPEASGEQALTNKQRKAVTTAINKLMVRKYSVDYRKPFVEICTDFLDFVFNTTRSLDMICRPWAPKEEVENLPSWILTVRDESHGQNRLNNTMHRRKGDIFVGDPGAGIYSASGRYPAKWEITWEYVNGKKKPVLDVNGFILDEISQKDDAASAGVVPETWFELGGWDTEREENPPEAFWRTMVADRDNGGGNPPPWYSLACRHAFFLDSVEYSAVSLVQAGDRLQDTTILKKYIRRIQSVIWGRRLAQTKNHGFLALTPREAREKDIICIIPGCSVPVVLRRRENGGYIFIGESYVDNMMDGAAFEIKRKHETAYQMFKLY